MKRTLRAGLILMAVIGEAAGVWAQEVLVGEPQWFVPPAMAAELPKAKRPLNPGYPEEMRNTGETGYVLFAQVIDVDGKNVSLAVRGTHRPFQRAVEQSLQRFEMRPASQGGQPVVANIWTAVIFNPANASREGPKATPRLLHVEPGAIPGALGGGDPEVLVVPVRLGIDATGAVSAATLAPGVDAILQTHVDKAVAAWRFAPARQGGVAVPAEMAMNVLLMPAPAESQPGTPPRVLRQRAPEYPMAMRQSRLRGEVLLGFVVTTQGKVADVVVERSNNPGFNEAAIACVREWTFKPAVVGGRPVNTRLQVPIIFEIEGGGSDAFTIARNKSAKKAAASAAYDTSPKVRGVLTPVYPFEALRDRKTGVAKAQILIDLEGNVHAVKVTEATLPEFGLALTAALEGFTFDPALKEGTPVRSVLAYEQKFDSFTMPSEAERRLARLEKSNPEKIVTLKALDTPLKPVSRKAPLFPRIVQDPGRRGEALIECLVDEEGRPRRARIVSATEPAFGYSAIQALATWQYSRPLAGGKPAVVRVRIPFVFGQAAEAEPPPPSP